MVEIDRLRKKERGRESELMEGVKLGAEKNPPCQKLGKSFFLRKDKLMAKFV